MMRASPLLSKALQFRYIICKVNCRRQPYVASPTLFACALQYTSTRAAPAFKKLDPSIPVEEEKLPGYKAEHYYPATFGQVLNDRYQIVGKLGYGTASTVWLCHDLVLPNGYAALKICVNDIGTPRELEIYEHIRAKQSQHDGREYIRRFYDSFKIEGPDGEHLCLVHEPLGWSIDEIRKLEDERAIPAPWLKTRILRMVRGLDFLHREANVIHTDLNPHNILLGIDNNSAFEKFTKEESEDPVPRKELSDRTIYASRYLAFCDCPPVITDFGEARFGDRENKEWIMPDVYRAPEVILDMSWSYGVDIWALGMLLWHMLEGKPIFFADDKNRDFSEQHHVAEMIAILGPPPADFLEKGEHSRKFWDADGSWICDVPIPDLKLESVETRLLGDDRNGFLALMRKLLQWRPEDRASCKEIFWDEWLLANLIASGHLKLPPDG